MTGAPLLSELRPISPSATPNRGGGVLSIIEKSNTCGQKEARKFAEVLDKASEEVDKSVFYTAGYDSPMKFWNRRNEIMYLVPGGR